MNSKTFYFAYIFGSVNVLGGPAFGTSYDVAHACQKCGSGAIPQGPRYIENDPNTSYRIFKTLDGETIIDTDLANKLKSKGISSLFEVFDSDKQKLPYMELRHQALLPRFTANTQGYEIEDQCPHCKRDGYFGVDDPLKLVYENIDEAITSNHILATFETFGNSSIETTFQNSNLSSPLLIFSDELVCLFQEENLSNMSFEKVAIDVLI